MAHLLCFNLAKEKGKPLSKLPFNLYYRIMIFINIYNFVDNKCSIDNHSIFVVTEVLQHAFLQPRTVPIDRVRPRNLFVDCDQFLKQNPINYGVFKGIFTRRFKAKYDKTARTNGNGRGGFRSFGKKRSTAKGGIPPVRQRGCIKHCLRSTKDRRKCRNCKKFRKCRKTCRKKLYNE